MKDDQLARSPGRITAVLVSRHIGQRQVLYLEVTRNGVIKRMGDGTEDCAEVDLFIGTTSREHFAAIQQQIHAEFLQWNGDYVDPSPVGQVCKLAVGFRFEDGPELTSTWTYGSASLGPPAAICQLVTLLLNLSEAWYEEQKQLRQGSREERLAHPDITIAPDRRTEGQEGYATQPEYSFAFGNTNLSCLARDASGADRSAYHEPQPSTETVVGIATPVAGTSGGTEAYYYSAEYRPGGYTYQDSSHSTVVSFHSHTLDAQERDTFGLW